MTTLPDFPFVNKTHHLNGEAFNKRVTALKAYCAKFVSLPFIMTIRNMPNLPKEYCMLRAHATNILPFNGVANTLNPQSTLHGAKCGQIRPDPKARPQQLIMAEFNTYMDLDLISDRYNEEARMQSRRFDIPLSPLELWQNDWLGIMSILSPHEQKIYAGPPNKARDEIVMKLASEIYFKWAPPSTFRPSIAIAIYKLFNARSILDISAGWGDRLAAACILGISYLGIDPNPLTQSGYAQIIKELGNGNQRTIMSPFETADIGNFKPDLIFTSPPYFDLEIYNSSDINQSINQYNNLTSWLDNFLLVSMCKAFDALQKGGHMCINMCDCKSAGVKKEDGSSSGGSFVEQAIIKFAQQRPQSLFLGSILYANIEFKDKLAALSEQRTKAFGGSTFKPSNNKLTIFKPQPIFVWAK